MPPIALTAHLRPAGFRWRTFAIVRSPFRVLTHPTEMQHELALSGRLRREICPRVHERDRRSHSLHTGASTLSSTRTPRPSRHHPSLRDFLHAGASDRTRRAC
jgi:hypothetical protein